MVEKMKDISHHMQQIKDAEEKIEYLNKRIKGVKKARSGQTNQAVINALKTELNQLSNEIDREHRRVTDNQNDIREIQRRDNTRTNRRTK